MPKVLEQGKTIECISRANLRKVLLQGDIDLYNNDAKVINCRLIGSCGTCAFRSRRRSQRTELARHETTFLTSLSHKKAA